MQAARPLADLIRRLSLKRVGHEASVGSLGDKGVPWSHNLKAHKAEGAEQGSCGGNRVRTAGQPALGLQAHLPTHVTAPNEGPGVLPTRESRTKWGHQQGVAQAVDRMSGHRGLRMGHGRQATPQAVLHRGWVAFSSQPCRSRWPWWSPTSVVAVLVEANEDVVGVQLLLGKLEKDCKAEAPRQDPPTSRGSPAPARPPAPLQGPVTPSTFLPSHPLEPATLCGGPSWALGVLSIPGPTYSIPGAPPV